MSDCHTALHLPPTRQCVAACSLLLLLDRLLLNSQKVALSGSSSAGLAAAPTLNAPAVHTAARCSRLLPHPHLAVGANGSGKSNFFHGELSLSDYFNDTHAADTGPVLRGLDQTVLWR